MSKLKKHEKIEGEINRMLDADIQYCIINDCETTDFMDGKASVYQDLHKFIKKLKK